MSEAGAPWPVLSPSEWPEPPARFSFSTLHELEGCPRRWALSNARYGPDGHHYPPKVGISTLVGQVIHASLEDLSTSIVAAGCQTAADIVGVLREVGGISCTIERHISNVTSQLKANPRMRRRIPEVSRALRHQAPEMRHVVQGALGHVFVGYPAGLASSRRGGARERGVLAIGLHHEVMMAPPNLEWIGWADALRLGPDICQIIDYKSGSPAPSHPEQLRIYALLWARDSVLNPLGRLADELVLVYPGKAEVLPAPNLAELRALEDDLRRRSASATAALRACPPPAHVGPATCQYCDVKQLCSPYWTPGGVDAIREPIEPTERSMQVVVTGRRASRVWELSIDADAYIPPGTAVIGTADRDLRLEIGCRVRLVDVRVSIDEEGGPALSLGPRSEVFSVPR